MTSSIHSRKNFTQEKDVTQYHTKIHKISHKDTQNITQRYTQYHTKIHTISHKDTQNITQRYTKYHTKIHTISHKDTQNITQRYTKYHTKIHKISHKDTQNITQRYTKYHTKIHKISHKDTQNITQRYTQYHTKIHKISHKDTQNSDSFDTQNSDSFDNPFSTQVLFNRGDTNLNCVYCDKNHISISCRIVTDVRSRYNILKNARRCYLCLKKGHVISKCFSNISCVKCKRRHNVSICNLYEDMWHENPHEEKSDVSRVNHVSNSRIPVILQTAYTAVSNPVLYKCHITCRILMDACSQRSYVTETVRRELNLQTQGKKELL